MPCSSTHFLRHYKKIGKSCGFTLIELLVSIGIIAILAAIVIIAIGPRTMIIKARDSARVSEARELSNALGQLSTEGVKLRTLPRFPQVDGIENAVPVCSEGMTYDNGCVNLDVLVTSGFIAGIPNDGVESCSSYSGYEVYTEGGAPFVFASNLGKTSGDDLVRHCTLDTLGPTISVPTFTLAGSTAYIDWTTSEAADGQVEYGETTAYGQKSTLNSFKQTNHSEPLTALKQFTTYHFRVYSRDAAGNLNMSDDGQFTTADTQDPVLVGGNPAATVTDSTAVITWNTDEASSSVVYFGTTTAFGQQASTGGNSTSHSVTLTGLTQNQTYHYQVRSTDGTGNLYASTTDYTFQTLPDIRAPEASNVTPTVAGDTITLRWDTDELANAWVSYGPTAAYENGDTTILTNMVLNHTVVISGLTPNASYHFNMQSADAAGNIGESGDRAITISDVTAPDLTAAPSETVTVNSATITWTTDEASITQLEYGLSPSYGTLTSLDSALTTSHSQTIQGLQYGQTYYYRIKLRDGAGNTAVSAGDSFDTAHNISIGSVTPADVSAVVIGNFSVASTAILDFGTSLSYGSNVQKTTLATTHTFNLVAMTAGTPYYYRITSTDGVGNTDVLTGTFTTTSTPPDTTPPTTSTPVVTYLNTANPVFTWNTNEKADTQIYYGPRVGACDATNDLTTYAPSSPIDNAPIATNGKTTGHTVTITGLADGDYCYKIMANDAVTPTPNALNDIYRSFKIDSDPPGISSGPTISGDVGTSFTVGLTADEAVTMSFSGSTDLSYNIEAYGSTTASTTPSVTIYNLANGTTYNYIITIRDPAGNIYRTVNAQELTGSNADSTAPTIQSGPTVTRTANGANTNVTIAWTTNENAWPNVGYSLDPAQTYATKIGTGSALGTSLSRSVNLPRNNLYHYRIYSKNVALLVGESSTDYTFSTDIDAPTITAGSIASSSIAATTATITWTTNEASNSVVEYGTTTAYGLSETVGANVTSHSVPLTGLSPLTQYHFRVKSTDASLNANMVTSGDSTFTTIDSGAPVISADTATAITDTTATITWTTDKPANSRVEYGADNTYGSATNLDSSLVTSHSQQITGLTAGETYHFRVKSVDASNQNTYGDDKTFTTTDATGPVCSAISESNITDSSVTISWSTNEKGDTQIDYGANTSYLLGPTTLIDTPAVNMTKTHSQVITGLTPATTYQYKVKSKDAAGNASACSNDSFATAADSTAPIINDASISASLNHAAHTATITWTTNENSYSTVAYDTGYGTTADASPNTLTKNHSVTLTGLTPNYQYHYQVISADAAGNSAPSSDKTFTIIDNTAPQLTAGPTIVSVTATTANITWSTNESATTQVDYRQNGTLSWSQLIDGTLVQDHLAAITGIGQVGQNMTYDYRIKSIDGGGNPFTDSIRTFSTDGVAPTITVPPAASVITQTTATITWDTNENATSLVEYGLTTGYGLFSTQNIVVTTSHNRGLTGLTAGQTYNYRVISIDAAGNQTVSGNGTFATLP